MHRCCSKILGGITGCLLHTLKQKIVELKTNKINMRNIFTQTLTVCATASALTFVTGCQSDAHGSTQASAVSATPAVTAPAIPSAIAAPTPAATQSVVRIKAGVSAPFTDSSGNVWQAETEFEGGDVIERDASMEIANTKDAGLTRSEHYGMSSFSCNFPNGKYIAKLHFAETFDGITGAGQRVFSFNVQGHEFKDFDVYVKAGGSNRAYVETFPVEITNGKSTITFASNIENPQINALELVPQS
jgi:hypothetical protein